MSLEEQTLEHAEGRCEECGATLTARELELALERGGPNLCSIHLDEAVEAEEIDGEPEPGAPAA